MAHAHNAAPNANANAGHGDAHGHEVVGHIVNPKILFATALALLALTGFTLLFHAIDMEDLNIWIALGIAFLKASLVGAFFMHLVWDRPFNLLVFVGCTLFVALMMAFCLMDTAEYRATQDTGNPPGAQAVLDRDAPGAPIAAQKAVTYQ